MKTFPQKLGFAALVFAVIMATSTSCSEEFLEVEPQVPTLAESNFYQTEGQVFQALIAAYDPLAWSFNGGFWVSSVMFGEIRSDNANAGGDPTNSDQPGWQQLDDFTNDVLTVESRWIWHKNYQGIYRANLVISNAQISTEQVAQFQGEAKVLRAFYHFDLFRHYGPIPVLTEPLGFGETGNFARRTMTQVFTQITKDLEEAIAVLPNTYGAEFAGRINKRTAQAILGKVYLYWADLDNDDAAKFDQAAAALQEVVNSGQYRLLDDFAQLFAFGADNTAEGVFEIQHDNFTGSAWDRPAGSIDGNTIIQLCGIRGLCSAHPFYEEGWGFMLPTQDLVDSYLADDRYRLDAAVISPQEIEDTIRANGGTCGVYVDISQSNQLDFEGYWQEKYGNYIEYPTSPNGGDDVLTKDANQKMIRYADVLLMLAEALHRGSGSDADAMTYIDEVRERAAGPGDNTGNFRTASDLMADEGWSLLEVIWYERRAEFALEGDRWYDLVRSGRAQASLFEGDKAGNFEPNDLWIPISQREIDAVGGGVLTPYPDQSLFQ